MIYVLSTCYVKPILHKKVDLLICYQLTMKQKVVNIGNKVFIFVMHIIYNKRAIILFVF